MTIYRVLAAPGTVIYLFHADDDTEVERFAHQLSSYSRPPEDVGVGLQSNTTAGPRCRPGPLVGAASTTRGPTCPGASSTGELDVRRSARTTQRLAHG